MKLTIEKHPDISRLTHCFQKIEALANDLGLEVDQLISDKTNDGFEDFLNIEQSKDLAKFRVTVFHDPKWRIIK